MCDTEISYDEIIEALVNMSKNKSPGSDGLTTEERRSLTVRVGVNKKLL
jgi:hypothetical protein